MIEIGEKMKTKKARKTRALQRGMKLEAKKPLFTAAEHGATTGGGNASIREFNFTQAVSKASS